MASKKNSKLLKYLVIGFVSLLLLVVVAKRMGWISANNEIKVSVEKVGESTIIETVSASGKVQPETEVKISSDVSGEVVDLYVKEGDKVVMGQLLAKVNPIIYQSGVERSEASLNNSKANAANAKARMVQSQSQLEKAKLSYDRSKKLFDDKVISEADWEAARSAYEVALADVEAAKQAVVGADYTIRSAQATVKEARDNLRKTSIFSPVAGIISKLNIEKGERVVGTSQMTGTEMMRIANLNEMEVVVDVSETDIIRVHKGDTALIDIDAYLDHKFKGIVTEVSSSANTSGASADQVTNFTVKVLILRSSYQFLMPDDKPDYSPFKPGMTANVDIQTKRSSQVLSVPIQAVTTRDTSIKDKTTKGNTKVDTNLPEKDIKLESKASECVFVVKDGKAELRNVKTGIQNTQVIEIISGLQKGEEIVTGPYSAISRQLKNKDKVKVVPKEELFEIKEK